MERKMTVRNCSRCGTLAEDSCSTCLAWFKRRPDASTLTPAERVAEFDSWFLTSVPEIPNGKVAERIGQLLGRGTYPFELSPAVDDALRRDILTGQRASMGEIVGKIPPGPKVIGVALADDGNVSDVVKFHDTRQNS
jgi:hypothetical protein